VTCAGYGLSSTLFASLFGGNDSASMAFMSLYIYRGLYQIDEKKNSAHPSIIYGIYLPSAELLIRAIMDYEILSIRIFGLPFVFPQSPLTVLFIVTTKGD